MHPVRFYCAIIAVALIAPSALPASENADLEFGNEPGSYEAFAIQRLRHFGNLYWGTPIEVGAHWLGLTPIDDGVYDLSLVDQTGTWTSGGTLTLSEYSVSALAMSRYSPNLGVAGKQLRPSC